MTPPSDYYEAKAYVEIRREQAAAAAKSQAPSPTAEAESPAPPRRTSLAARYDDARWNALTDRIAERMDEADREGEWD